MKIGLVGETYQEQSIPYDAQRSINLYPVFDKSGREVAAMYGTPGLSLFATAGNGPIRGEFSSTNNRAFAVSANKLFEVLSDGNTVERGTLLTSSGIVYIEENPTQLAICDGINLYILTYSTNVFAQVTDPDLPSSGSLTFIDGYFVVNKNDSGSFYISALNNGTSWAALDFATAESSPDKLRRVINAVGQLWLFGDRTTEVFTNTGAASFPFERISGAKMEVGIVSGATAIAMDNSVFWVGRDRYGSCIVYRANGFSPQRVSTDAIERVLQSASDLQNLRAWAYQENGHVFYAITGGSLETTLVYDITTQLWHERSYFVDGAHTQHRAHSCMVAFDKILVGDRESGKIYQMSKEYYSDAGDEIIADRIFTHISNEEERFKVNTLAIAMETGVGLQIGQGSNPKISLRVSWDGARTWSNWYDTSFGQVGEYQAVVNWNRLGTGRVFTAWVRISDPVKRALIGSYIR